MPPVFDPNDPLHGLDTRARLEERDPDIAGLEAKLRALEAREPRTQRQPGPNLLRRILRIIRGGGD